jgi:hypothetical protein
MAIKTSCVEREPLSKLQDDGTAAVLNYNLPQSTVYDVVSFIELDVPDTAFKKAEHEPPQRHFWADLDRARQTEDLNVERIRRVIEGKTYSSVTELQHVSLNLNSTAPVTRSGLMVKAANVPVSTKSVEFSSDLIANRINEGLMPVVTRRLSGKQDLRFVRQPAKPRPTLFIRLHMKMASYLGDYGAGQTLSTFSLLPREKTTISVRTYQRNEETKASAQSVLDSYSESCSDELQTTIEARTQQSVSFSETDTDSMSADLSVDAGINLGIVKLGGETSGSASSVNTTTEAVSSQVDTLTSAVDHHVQTADTQRQIEINTETTSTSTTETEETITRVLENLNGSRVLNFPIRQLLQEYFTITYLDRVSFVYSNGYPSRRRTADLSSLGNLLRDVLVSKEAVEEIRSEIWEQLCNIQDHQGTRTSFIELATVESRNCIDPRDEGGRKVAYVRKRAGLVQTYRDKSVPGIILNVTHRVLRTPAFIVEALLGRGEALDCFNQELQDASQRQAHLANRKVEQGLAIVEAAADPAEKAGLYRQVFGECCCDEDAADGEE